MGLRDLIKKKDHLDGGVDRETLDRLAGPEFTFIRSDTHTQEIIHPPTNKTYLSTTAARDNNSNNASGGGSGSRTRRSLDVFRPRSRGSSTSSVLSDGQNQQQQLSTPAPMSTHRRLSQRLHLSKAPSTSEFVPENLPQINVYAADGKTTGGGKGGVGLGPGGVRAVGGGVGGAAVDKDANESQWEKRATILAEANERGQRRSRSPSVNVSPSPSSRNSPYPSSADLAGLRLYDDDVVGNGGGNGNGGNGRSDGVVSSKVIDEQIQEAIRLHEGGQLDQSTRLFGRLADPQGANNPLSQVLYGLALRHGWGCEPDPERAVTYLSAAASNAAAVESMALQAGLKKGGAAKGELVLAIFELANCFRHGWGIPRDPVAAKQYYETAANLGDTDAMNEVGWCYLEGFGCKKDKYAAARYYRLAEENGNKTLGNTWIWKDKYNPTNSKNSKK
ncbi:HCP-like protein [Annulohypoxylon maeteangense]|uniref:HCP-like protein n=1 Tax=Annulohypoxylon maeteangense TaxID=1927788 RepID=UPI002007432E|nr:HCP-like protein [Annulohypoxylon maeteangense]KAI0888633.1 HCP-like protein [Annulohypoxylon maeteangense]